MSAFDPDADDPGPAQRGRAETIGDKVGEERTGDVDYHPLFPTVQDWVAGFLAPTIARRSSSDFVWCPRWWAHAEVVSRLTGLWITWEQARGAWPGSPDTVGVVIMPR